MRAALLEAPNEELLIVDDIDIGDPRPHQVRVQVANCGVCHSDLHVIDGHVPSPLPAVLGHEAAGHVESVGDAVTGLHVGDPVIMTLKPVCGRCYFCVRGQPTLCATHVVHIPTSYDPPSGEPPPPLSRRGQPVYPGINVGGFAEYAIISADAAVRVPDDTPLDVACLIGCAVQTGVGAVLNTARVEEGATVLVQGLGGVGASIVQGARLAGASHIIAVDPIKERRNLALDFGATLTIDPGHEDLAAVVLADTGGIGVDYAFDAVGDPRLIQTGLDTTRPGGTTVCVGVPGVGDTYRIPALAFALGEKKLLGCYLGSSNPQFDFHRLLSLWRSGRIDLNAMVTARRPLEEINEAFADMKAGRGIRTVIDLTA